MSFLNRVSQALEKSFINAGRTRARLDLLGRSDRFLEDNGFARSLLEQGNDAWPWRLDGVAPAAVSGFALPPAGLRTPVPAASLSSRELAQAEAELSALSDAELSDLGLGRADIAEAVRNGRPELDGSANETGERMAA